MENDASSAGVTLGGLFNTADIKILICYILSAVKEPVPVTMLANVLHYEGIANAFEVSDAVVLLSKSGHITLCDEKDGTYTVTEVGRSAAKTLDSSLSMTVKNRAYNATLKMLARFRNAKSTDFKITKENGYSYLTCSALDGEKPFISVKMLVTDDSQAMFIKERFLNDASEIYSKIIELLTK